jgi:hypothetical protein
MPAAQRHRHTGLPSCGGCGSTMRARVRLGGRRPDVGGGRQRGPAAADREALRQGGRGAGASLDRLAPGDDAIAQIQQHIEQRWCNEPVPALGGLTPMQAAADPTRREQLERLLASFDATEAPPGAITMRTDHQRTALGL